jgi:uncharacterized protein (DUF433 family)
VAYLRRQRGWSQRDLASKAGIRQPEISRIEAGLITPNEATLERLASALAYRLTLMPLDKTNQDLNEDEEKTPMNGAKWHDRIWSNPGMRSGQPLIRGMRITVRDVLEYLAGGMTPDEIVRDFPELDLEDIHASLAYAAAHLEPMPV